jgi:hypothetical protein
VADHVARARQLAQNPAVADRVIDAHPSRDHRKDDIGRRAGHEDRRIAVIVDKSVSAEQFRDFRLWNANPAKLAFEARPAVFRDFCFHCVPRFGVEPTAQAFASLRARQFSYLSFHFDLVEE